MKWSTKNEYITFSDDISTLDNVSGSEEERTYENGCNYLLSWFNSLK